EARGSAAIAAVLDDCAAGRLHWRDRQPGSLSGRTLFDAHGASVLAVLPVVQDSVDVATASARGASKASRAETIGVAAVDRVRVPQLAAASVLRAARRGRIALLLWQQPGE